MNILQVHHNWDESEPGGIVAMMNDLMDGLESRGHRVTLLVNDWHAPQPAAHVDRTGRPYFRFNLAPIPARLADLKALLGWLWRFPLAVWRLRRFCRAHAIDVAQLHYADALYLVFAVLRLCGGPPFVVTVHRGDVLGYAQQPPLKRWAFQRVMRRAAATVAVSRALGELALGVSPAIRRLTVIHNGYTPADEPVLGRTALAQSLGVALPQTYAVMVGNCRPYKGFDIALQAWSRLRTVGVALPLLVVGGGPDLQATRKLADELGLDELVTFVGPRPRAEAVALTAHAGLQVVPSRNEGQGIVILEAGHAGTPVVCSDIAPFLEMVAPGRSGFVFRSEDPADMARAVAEALEDAARAARYAAQLRQQVVDGFSVAAMVDGYLRLFAELTGKAVALPAQAESAGKGAGR